MADKVAEIARIAREQQYLEESGSSSSSSPFDPSKADRVEGDDAAGIDSIDHAAASGYGVEHTDLDGIEPNGGLVPPKGKLTLAVNDIEPSVGIPAEAAPVVQKRDDGSLERTDPHRPGHYTSQTTPNPPTLSSRDFVVTAASYENGGANGRIPEEDEDDAAKQAEETDARAPSANTIAQEHQDNNHQTDDHLGANGGDHHDRKSEPLTHGRGTPADDFLANSGKPAFTGLPGGGKGVRKASFVSLLQHGKFTASNNNNESEVLRFPAAPAPAAPPAAAAASIKPSTATANVNGPSSPPSSSQLRKTPTRSQTTPAAHTLPLVRASSLPHRHFGFPHRQDSADTAQGGIPSVNAASPGQSKWTNLKQRLQRRPTVPATGSNKEINISITDELLLGGLGVLLLKMEIDRDEKGRKRVPVLLRHVKFRVSDSIGGASNHPVFRIECEYGDGKIKWVLYRNLRDFLSLHAHYKGANLTRITNRSSSHGSVDVPEFPKSSIPYFHRKARKDSGDEKTPTGMEKGKGRDTATSSLHRGKGKDQGGSNGQRQDFALNQREALEHYLMELVRAVMYRPESNRLIRFLELSALTLQLAVNGGSQGKSGYLRVMSMNVSKKQDRPMLAPVKWIQARRPKWWIVRESYLIAVEEPDQDEIFDIFPFDQDFAIERPKRATRKIINSTSHGKDRIHEEWGSIIGDSDGEDAAEQAAEEARIARLEGDIHGLGAMNAKAEKEEHVSHHTFYVHNSQGRLKLVAKNIRQMQQFILSLEKMAGDSIWAGKNRFDSFAPIRLNVPAQWMVDARDYFWAVSRALLDAKKCVYIHDWWLSPELYLRRPGEAKWRLDNIMKKKAEEGVKFHVIVYNEVSNKTTPTDSLWTKKSLRDLHPNIFIQRSPSHFQTGTFYWSHHEKMCVIDESVAFMGGVDLCYGRWDTPQHALIDDDFEPGTIEGENGPIWPGKDYNNARVLDFHTLNKPFEDQHDRNKVPRMPWHDIAMTMKGQPARDLCRHFIQRWNHLLRIKNHSMAMPFLVPPPDYSIHELSELGLTGTCEIQVCRSCGPWSMGTPSRVEHSIQNAYLKAIQLSEHFVYIENQFFITSTVVEGIVIENQIGDALVNRIIQAHEEGTPWRACIVIPSLPGYPFPIDTDAASSVRLIVECQNKSICRGPNSIFARLRQQGIDPEDYISFFSLRGWGKFKNGVLTTEQVYIHAKCMVVDDRLVIIGSANINERSQRGDRDSELASVIRDTDMMDSRMAGKPYRVGRFAHTLRLRLMREHLGIDVDAMEEEDLLARDQVAHEEDIQTWDPGHEQEAAGERADPGKIKTQTVGDRMMAQAKSVAQGVVHSQTSSLARAGRKIHDVVAPKKNDLAHPEDDIEVFEVGENHELAKGYVSAIVPTMEERVLAEHGLIDGPLKRNETENGAGDIAIIVQDATSDKEEHPVDPDEATAKLRGDAGKLLTSNEAHDVKRSQKEPLPLRSAGDGLYRATSSDSRRQAEDAAKGNEANTRGQSASGTGTRRSRKGTKILHPWEMPLPTPHVDPNCLIDPLDEVFWKETWVAVAIHNTEIFRKVFRCTPDDLVTSWAQYRENASHAEKFNKSPMDDPKFQHNGMPYVSIHGGPGTHGAGGGGSGGGVVGQGQGDDEPSQQQQQQSSSSKSYPSSPIDVASPTGSGSRRSKSIGKRSLYDDGPQLSGPTEGWNAWEREKMEELLNETRGHLVVYPTRFMEAEDLADNFLFNSDKILPLPIYD